MHAVPIRLSGMDADTGPGRSISPSCRDAAHLQVNKATMGLLKYVEPYVTFGYPNLKTVKALLYKRGFGKVGIANACMHADKVGRGDE